MLHTPLAVEYLERCLSSCGSRVRGIQCAGARLECKPSLSFTASALGLGDSRNRTSYETQWEKIHAWLPRTLLPTAPQGDVTGEVCAQQQKIICELHRRIFPECTMEKEGAGTSAGTSLTSSMASAAAMPPATTTTTKTAAAAATATAATTGNKGSSLSTLSGGGSGGTNLLGDSIDMCRAQLAVLSEVLCVQESKALQKIKY